MDSYSIPAAAKALGTSAPRVYRAVERLGFEPSVGQRGMYLTAAQLEILREALGDAKPAGNLSRETVKVLAALASKPRGVRSKRAVARAAGVSPTTVGKVLDVLERNDVVRVEQRVLPEGAAREVNVLALNSASPVWRAVAPDVRRVHLHPEPQSNSDPKTVPVRLRHHFWNSDVASLRLPENADYVASRLLRTNDPDAIVWAAEHLPATAIRKACTIRGMDEAQKTLIMNLVASRE
ncbi:MAG: hypothetical protein M0Z30_01900 [Actinomycetota bacterium]|nr:hypothetical protein [Actinomycetota bacterium]